MGFAELSLICLVGLVGPLLALPRGARVPVVVGELAAGVIVGRTGLGWVDADDPALTLLADVGFALVMFVVGTHVPFRDPRLRRGMRIGAGRAVGTGAAAALAGWALAAATGTGDPALYAVLMASSSAALVFPVIDERPELGPRVLTLLPQVALADAAAIVALPLVIEPERALRAAGGAAAVLAAAGVVLALLWYFDRRGWRRRVHRISEERLFATELRLQLVLLFALAALASAVGVSVMLAGFAFGIGVAAIGEPRRLARQLFALTEGFLGPIFFVWLGAALDLRALGENPELLLAGLGLGIGGALVHLLWVPAGQPAWQGLLAAAQLGVPVAAATIGTRTGALSDGEASAVLLGALITIGLAVLGANLGARALRGGAAPVGPPD